MEKIIQVEGQTIRLKSSGAFLLKYKAQFRRDPLADIMAMAKSLDSGGDIATLDTEVLYNILWSLAKNANPSIDEPIRYFEHFETFPILDNEVLNAVIDLALKSMGASVESKKK